MRWSPCALLLIGCASAGVGNGGGDDDGGGGGPNPDARVITPPDACADDDNDGSCNTVDLCPGADDRVDTDADTVADGCDRCQGQDDRVDVNMNMMPDCAEVMQRTVDLKIVAGNHWRGWFSSGSARDSTTNDNTITGISAGATYNSYFVFPLAGVTASHIVSVTAELELESMTGVTAATASVWDVTTPPAQLETTALNPTIFSDLQGGNAYGTKALVAADVGTVVSIPLSAQAAADLRTKLGQDFAIGVHNDTGAGYFRFSKLQEARVARLVISYLP